MISVSSLRATRIVSKQTQCSPVDHSKMAFSQNNADTNMTSITRIASKIFSACGQRRGWPARHPRQRH